MAINDTLRMLLSVEVSVPFSNIGIFMICRHPNNVSKECELKLASTFLQPLKKLRCIFSHVGHSQNVLQSS